MLVHIPPYVLLLQAVSIHIPPVREIPAEQQAALRAAATTWHAAVTAHGARHAMARPPAEVSFLEGGIAQFGFWLYKLALLVMFTKNLACSFLGAWCMQRCSYHHEQTFIWS